jgi:hypothetical protein
MNSLDSQDLETSISYAEKMKCWSDDNCENLVNGIKWNADDLEMIFLKETYKNILNIK